MKRRLSFLGRRIGAFPADEVTTISDRELPETGHEAPDGAVRAIWKKVRRYYGLGLHPAMALCVRYRGKTIIDRAIGHTRGNAPDDSAKASLVKATPDTPFSVFSASKAVTAMLTMLAVERGDISLDDRVADYIDGFARHGKGEIRIRHVLCHRAGLAKTPPEGVDLNLLHRWDEIIELLCDLEPDSMPGDMLAYHALTGGYILAEVVRQATGIDLQTMLDREVRGPLGFETFTFGVPEERLPDVAADAATGPRTPPLVKRILRRALGVDVEGLAMVANDPLFRTAMVPSGNLISTADEACRFFELLLRGGRLGDVRVFKPETVALARRAQTHREIDRTILFPVRYGLAFMLGAERFSLYGSDTPQAFGHLGFSNVILWADPERDLSAAFLNSGKPLFTPEFLVWRDVLSTIAQVIPRARRIRP